MIKGRYVAMVTIDFNYPDDLLEKFTFEDIKKRLIFNTENSLRMIIEDECSSDYDIVDVQRQYADLYRVPEDEMEDKHDHEHDQG